MIWHVYGCNLELALACLDMYIYAYPTLQPVSDGLALLCKTWSYLGEMLAGDLSRRNLCQIAVGHYYSQGHHELQQPSCDLPLLLPGSSSHMRLSTTLQSLSPDRQSPTPHSSQFPAGILGQPFITDSSRRICAPPLHLLLTQVLAVSLGPTLHYYPSLYHVFPHKHTTAIAIRAKHPCPDQLQELFVFLGDRYTWTKLTQTVVFLLLTAMVQVPT